MKVACTHFQAAAGIFQYLKVHLFCIYWWFLVGFFPYPLPFNPMLKNKLKRNRIPFGGLKT